MTDDTTPVGEASLEELVNELTQRFMQVGEHVLELHVQNGSFRKAYLRSGPMRLELLGALGRDRDTEELQPG